MGERMKSNVSNITAELDTCHHRSHGFERWSSIEPISLP
ncbi:hypothetical protein SynROS8604_02757 [Synechococcus sp. ROS8604]|nr:hypothetical protein SynROS8604_02757 [Synechococcus sp. ROS8604]